MKAFFKLRIISLAILATLCCSQMMAGQHHKAPQPVCSGDCSHCRHSSCVKVERDHRLSILLSYLDKHKDITAKKYAKLTKLSERAARAELDAFASNHSIPVQVAFKKSKRVYVRASSCCSPRHDHPRKHDQHQKHNKRKPRR